MTNRATWDEPLVVSARRWIQEALMASVNDDHRKVVLLAPIAVEHLGKAALWKRNPVLLAILDKNHAASFMNLATKPDLNDPQLRTIGLSEVLDRLAKLPDTTPPVNVKRRRRLVEHRGSAIHVGQSNPQVAEHVLSDALTMFVWLAGQLGIDLPVLFGIHTDTAMRLLDERRTRKQRRVDQALDKARLTYQRLAVSIGPDLLPEAITMREDSTLTAVGRILHRMSIGSNRRCPSCGHLGVVLGDLEVDPEVYSEGGPDGPVFGVTYNYELIPDSFYCNVCELVLLDVQELQIAGLPHERFTLVGSEITDELVDYARDLVLASDFGDQPYLN